MSILVVADDFTGACDTGLQYAKAGLKTVALIEPGTDALDETGDVDVVVIDTETRQLSRTEARQRVRDLCGGASRRDVDLVYKKVDSALRGNLAGEIAATMEAFGAGLCLMAPAFPASGRITVGGYHLVHGVPVDRSEVGLDPGSPVRGSYLPHLLDVEPSLAVKTLELEDVAQGEAHIRAMVEGLAGAGPTVIVIDAASDSDLESIATAAAKLATRPMLCGSAGLAAHVPAAFGLAGKGARPIDLRAEGHALLVIGTAESTTRHQVSALRASRGVPEWEVHVDMTAFGWKRPHLPEVVASLQEQLAKGHAVLSLVGLHAGMHRDDADHAMRAIGEAARKVISSTRPAGLVVSGGWTAVTVLREIGATGAEICAEASPAVPLCRVVGGAFDGLPLVTKGGALGQTDALMRAVDVFVKSAAPDPERPILAITMGDACGVGPEIIAKGMAHREVYDYARPFVIGEPELLRQAIALVGSGLIVRPVAAPEEAAFEPGTVDVYNPIEVDRAKVVTGTVCAEAGRAAAEWVIAGVDLAKANRIDAIVTAPLNKEAMNLAGYAYPGHTELLADRSGAKGARLMLASERLNVSHVTGHIALHDVPKRLTRERVYETIVLTYDAVERLRGRAPRLAVCGLNPHAGENGLFGDEDDRVIRPAIEDARAHGWDIDGPLPADTTFFKVYDGVYDGVVAMYHDQGHVPAKLVAFADAVNVTLGLPIVRTSVDHGTAFDIAGRGIAREGNLLEALRLAARLAAKRGDPEGA